MRVIRTEVFDKWFYALPDDRVFAAVEVRLQRLAAGNLGDASGVGEGVMELRIHIGAGWRVYFIRRGEEIAVLLCGGSKRSQARDIARARGLAAHYVEDGR